MIGELLFFLADLALLLSAAKAHGRQLRLEREAHGILHVTFGGHNDPWVEARWAWERRWFWSLYPVLLGLAVGWVWLAAPPGSLSMLLPLALLWTFSLDLTLMGWVAWWRHWRGPGPAPRFVPSAAWWSLVIILSVLIYLLYPN